MKETRPVCQDCQHAFHAMAPCCNYNYTISGPCQCKGVWYDETKAISGFCYVFTPSTVDTERAAHAACPGKGYVYPCECECHDPLSSS